MIRSTLSRLVHVQKNLCGFSTSKQIKTITSPDAPKAIGPYSQAKIVKSTANLVFCSGQVAIDPKTGNLVSDDVSEQTERVMKNLEAVLKASNSSFENVVKSVVYLTDMVDYAKVNEIYGKYFKNEAPARVCFAVKGLPKNAKVEIELIAVSDD